MKFLTYTLLTFFLEEPPDQGLFICFVQQIICYILDGLVLIIHRKFPFSNLDNVEYRNQGHL